MMPRPCPRETTIADAETSLGRSPEERWEIFCGIQDLIGAIWDPFSEEEMRRRLEIGERLHRPPDPWWRNIKVEDAS